MTGSEFKAARKARLKYSQAELAIAMQTPKRTIQDIEALADQDVRGVYAVCIELLIERDNKLMGVIVSNIDKCLTCRFPHGFQSAPAKE